jgi:tripartite-type tricarboxylate transporter receptor subunit TctC
MTPKLIRDLFKTALAASVGFASQAALAQDFPNRPLKLIVPYSAGSTTDLIARIAAQELGDRLKQPVAVDNRTGAGGTVGVSSLKASPKDGYTLGLIVSGNVIAPWMSKDMSFDVRKDFTAISMLWAGPYILTVPPAFPATNMAEFLAEAKKRGKPMLYGSSGSGTTTHLAGELLMQMTGIPMTHVPYRGSPQVVAGLMSGDIDFYFDLYGTTRPLMDSGKVKALGISSLKPLPAMPELPTIDRTLKGFEVLAWTGFAVPEGTPKAVVDKLSAEIRAAMNKPEVNAKIAAFGVQPGGNSPAEFSAFVNAEYDKWGRIITAAGLNKP